MESRKIRVDYPLDKIGAQVFSDLAIKYDVEPNVLAADIDPHKGGWLLLGISGEADRLDAAEGWMRGLGLTVSNA